MFMLAYTSQILSDATTVTSGFNMNKVFEAIQAVFNPTEK